MSFEFNFLIISNLKIDLFKITQTTVVSCSIKPKHRPKSCLFSTLELCGTDEGSKSTSFHSKGRSREFLRTFFGKKVPAIARHEGRQGCAEKALEAKPMFSKNTESHISLQGKQAKEK
ncbi:hypothetical protein [Pelobium manganitolerans]|uniref:hypothetical protein n=1 Tax=Pelobium manganitolerans TaxID=1842495 RepID=UPI003FA3AC76